MRAVVHRDDIYAFWQTAFDFFQAVFHALNDRQSTAALTHHHDARYHLAHTVKIRGTTANIRPEHDSADVLNAYRSSVLRGKYRFLEVFCGLNVAAPADHVLRAAEFQQAGSGLAVGGTNRVGDARDRNAIAAKPIGINIDLVLLRESTQGGDVSNPRHRFQVIL